MKYIKKSMGQILCIQLFNLSKNISFEDKKYINLRLELTSLNN